MKRDGGSPSFSAAAASLNIFLEMMFCVTNSMALAKAMIKPMKFALKSAEQAITTPNVSGTRERYVGIEYWIP